MARAASSNELRVRDLLKGRRAVVLYDGRKNGLQDYIKLTRKIEEEGVTPLLLDAWSGVAGDLILWAGVEEIPAVVFLRNGKLIANLSEQEVLGRSFKKKIEGWK